MNTKLLLLALSVAAISGCSTAYKSGQTPDDVYYSPARFYGEDKTETKNDNSRDFTRSYSEERQIRLGINDPRWRSFDNR